MAARNFCVQLGLWFVVVVAFVFVGGSLVRREVSVLAVAAWLFIIVFPLLQVLIQKCVGVDDRHRCPWLCWSAQNDDGNNDAEEGVSYNLRGNVVNVEIRERLRYEGNDSNAPTEDIDEDMWYNIHKDTTWYHSGGFSFWFAIAKAMLNLHSITRAPFQLDLQRQHRDTPGWVGRLWVASIEVPYMCLVLLPLFFLTAAKLCRRFSCREHLRASLPYREDAGKLVVQLSGLLKTLGRFSALNLLEFIRIDDFMGQDKMQKVMSIIGAVIGFMAFRCKIADVPFLLNHHVFDWTFGQKIRMLALINNMVSITDTKAKMIFVAIQSKYYRKDRWLEAVGDHLLYIKLFDTDTAWEPAVLYRVLKRLVSMGPDDVNRLIEDLIIERRKPVTIDRPNRSFTSSGPPIATRTNTQYIANPQSDTGRRRKIPKQIWDDCWNWQLTNIVGVIRFGLFWFLADEAESASQSRQPPLEEGKVSKFLKLRRRNERDSEPGSDTGRYIQS